jgi:hypothetical protein
MNYINKGGKYMFVYNKETGKVITTLSELKTSGIETYVTGGKGSPRIPRAYTISNIEGNKEIYIALLNRVGETIRMTTDQIDGMFEISLKGDEIFLKEVTQ